MTQAVQVLIKVSDLRCLPFRSSSTFRDILLFLIGETDGHTDTVQIISNRECSLIRADGVTCAS